MKDIRDMDGPEWLEYAARELRRPRQSDRGGNVVLLMFSIPAAVFLATLGLFAVSVAIAGRHDDKAGMNEFFLLMALAPLVVIFGILSLFVLVRRGGGFAWWFNVIVNSVAILIIASAIVLTLIHAAQTAG